MVSVIAGLIPAAACPPLMTHELPSRCPCLPKFIIAEKESWKMVDDGDKTLQQFEIRMSNFPPEQSSLPRIGQADKKVDFITILFVSTVRPSCSERRDCKLIGGIG